MDGEQQISLGDDVRVRSVKSTMDAGLAELVGQVYGETIPLNPMSEAALRRAIAKAELILPGRPSPAGKRDPRWQAILRVGEFIESNPATVCDFAMKWAKRRGKDLQSAIGCCLIEHLLEHHFDLVFPRMRQAALANVRVAEHFVHYNPYFQFGQATLPKNVARIRRLARELRRRHGGTRAVVSTDELTGPM